LLMLLLPY